MNKPESSKQIASRQSAPLRSSKLVETHGPMMRSMCEGAPHLPAPPDGHIRLSAIAMQSRKRVDYRKVTAYEIGVRLERATRIADRFSAVESPTPPRCELLDAVLLLLPLCDSLRCQTSISDVVARNVSERNLVVPQPPRRPSFSFGIDGEKAFEYCHEHLRNIKTLLSSGIGLNTERGLRLQEWFALGVNLVLAMASFI